MKKLPLYRPDEKSTIIDRTTPLPRNVNCRLCPRGGALTPEACLPPQMQVGTGHQMVGSILVVGGEPSTPEAINGKIFASAAAIELRVLIEQLAPGRSIVYDRAIRCAPHDDDEKKKSNDRVEPCRGYLRAVLNAVKPERIFAFGGHAHESLLGRRPDQDSIRRGYAYLEDGTVVYLFKNFVFAVYNTFEKEELREDVAWALNASPPKPPWDGSYYLVETLEHAEAAVRTMYEAGPYFTFDLETSGPFRDDGYRLLCGAFSPAGWVNDTFLFTEDCLLIPEVKALLAKLMVDLQPCGHNLQFDLKHLWSWVGLVEPVNHNVPVFQTTIFCDTMWVIRQRDSRCAKALSHAAEIVGMGGHKKRNTDALKAARREIKQRMQDYLDAGRNIDGLLLLPNRLRKTIHAAVRFLCDVDPKGKNTDMFSHGLVPPDIEYQYCALDTVSTARLVEEWAPLIHPTSEQRAADPEAQRMWFQWTEFTEPVIKVAAQMEIWGLPTDPTVLKVLRKKVDRVVANSEKKLRNLGFTADEFTNETIRTYLFTTLNYPILNHKESLTDTGLPSCGAPALELLNKELKKSTGVDDPVITLLLDRAAAEKVSSSFTMGIAGRVTGAGLVHHSLLPEGADTGRWASKDPNCFDGETELLTDRGWVRFDALKPHLDDGALVLQAHTSEDGGIWSEFVTPTRYVEEPATDWVDLSTRAIKLRLTSGHQCLLQNRAGKWKKFSAVDFPEDHKQHHCCHHTFPTGDMGLELDENEVRLLCAIQADGHYVPGAVEFSFSKERKVSRLREALSGLGDRVKFNEKPVDNRGRTRFRVWTSLESTIGNNSAWYLRGLLTEKKVWGSFILDFHEGTAYKVESELFHWDGSYTRGNCYSTSDRESADWIQILQSLCGRKSRLREYTNENLTKPNWQLDNSAKVYSWTTNVEKHLIDIPDGIAYCVEVPSHNVMVRRNGCVAITGQTQNLPSHGPWAKEVKRAFRPEDPDHVFMQVDFASMELRDAAGLSMDQKYAEVFIRGEDPHLGTAKLVWDLEGMTPDEMKPWRSKAKCYHPDTEVLTRTGWMKLSDVVRRKKTPEIAICHPEETQGSQPVVRTTFEQPLEAFEELHPDQKLLQFREGYMTADVTPDHGMLVWKGDGKPVKMRADEFATTKDWDVSWAVTTDYTETDRSKLPERIRRLSDTQLTDIAECCAIFQARAYFHKADGNWNVAVQDGITGSVFEHAGLRFDEVRRSTVQNHGTRLSLAPGTYGFIRNMMLSRKRGMPQKWWMELPPQAKRKYLTTLWRLSWDHNNTRSGYRRITCRSKIDSDLISAMAATCGLYAEVEERVNMKHKDPKVFYDVFLDQESDGVARENTYGSLDWVRGNDRPKVTPKEWTRKVACVTVSSGYILTRRLGKTLVCGNTVNFGCVSMDTKILTQDGWKTYDEVCVGDKTPGISGKWVSVLEKVKYESAPTVEWEGFCVTPNHRWFSERRTTVGGVRQYVEEVTTLEDTTTDHRIFLSKHVTNTPGKAVSLSKDEVALIGWILTDGSYKRDQVSIFQCKRVNPHKLDTILRHLETSGVEYHRYDRKAPSTIVELRFKPEYKRRFKRLVDSVDEEWVLHLNPDQRAAFIEAGLLAEGHKEGKRRSTGGRWCFTQREGSTLEAYRLAFHLEGHFLRQNKIFGSGKYKANFAWRLKLSKPYVTGQRLSFVDSESQDVWCVRTEDESWTMRRGDNIAVTGNTLYGKGVYSLAPDLGVTEPEAQDIVDQILGTYESLGKYIEKNKAFIAENGFQHTHWWDEEKGAWVPVNKRYLTGAGSPDFKHRSAADRQSTNTDVQGSSALKTTKSCIRVVKKIHERNLPFKLRNAVHDSLIVTAPKERAIEASHLVRDTMEECQSWIVPTKADIELGPTWAGMMDLDKLETFAQYVKAGIDDASIAHLMQLCKPGKFTDETCAPLRKICETIGLL